MLTELLQDDVFVLSAGFVLVAGKVLAWMYLSQQRQVPRTAGYALRVLLRLAIPFYAAWLLCEWWGVSAIFFLLVCGAILLILVIYSVFNIGAYAALWILQQYVLGFPAQRPLVLQADTADSASTAHARALIGQRGVAVSSLRPAGTIEVNGRRYHAAAENAGFIDRGATVIVRLVTGAHVLVEQSE